MKTNDSKGGGGLVAGLNGQNCQFIDSLLRAFAHAYTLARLRGVKFGCVNIGFGA